MGAALLGVVLGSGCSDPVSVDVGMDRISPVELERGLSLGGGALLGCPEVERSLAPDRALAASASIAPVTSGCLARLRLEDALLVDAGTVDRIADSIDGFDRTALVGFDVQVDALSLDADGAPLSSETVRELRILLEGETVLAASDPGALAGQRVALPESVVDAFFEAVDARRELRVDLEVRLTFREGEALPERLHVRMVLQPILRIDVVRAAL